jgi:hypothetical protein
VKFIVNVNVVENSVNSHVGSVMLVNVMIQYKVPGTTRSTAKMTRKTSPNVEAEAESFTPRAAVEAFAPVDAEAMVDVVSGELHVRACGSRRAFLPVNNQRRAQEEAERWSRHGEALSVVTW